MSTPNPEEEIQRLSQVIENLNFALATQAAELSMKNGHLTHAKDIYKKAARNRDIMKALLADIGGILGIDPTVFLASANPDDFDCERARLAIAMEISQLIQDRRAGGKVKREFFEEFELMKKERDDLRQWKESAMQVESKWDEQKIARLLKLPLGVSVRASLQPAIEKLIEEKEALRSGCLSDPLLKATVDPLFKENEELKFQLESAWSALREMGAKFTALKIPRNQESGFLRGGRMLTENERLDLLIERMKELDKSSDSDRKERQEYAEKLIGSNLELEALKIQLANLNAEIDECRDNILHERHQLEGGVLDSDQINAVLGVFDDSITQPVSFVCDTCKARVGKVTNGDCDFCRAKIEAVPAARPVYECVCCQCKKTFKCNVFSASLCDDCTLF